MVEALFGLVMMVFVFVTYLLVVKMHDHHERYDHLCEYCKDNYEEDEYTTKK